jgi:hypothetical protein
MTTHIPYPDAQNLFDILTDDQKIALRRIESQNMLMNLERGKPEQIPYDHWINILYVNVPRIAQAVEDGVFHGEWQQRATTFLQYNQQYLQPRPDSPTE